MGRRGRIGEQHTCRAEDNVELLHLAVRSLDSSLCEAPDGFRHKIDLCAQRAHRSEVRQVKNSKLGPKLTLSSHNASRYPGPGVSLRHATGNSGTTASPSKVTFREVAQAQNATHASPRCPAASPASSPCSRGRAPCPFPAAASRGAWTSGSTVRRAWVRGRREAVRATHVHLVLERAPEVPEELWIVPEALELLRREVDCALSDTREVRTGGKETYSLPQTRRRGSGVWRTCC